MLEHSTFAHDLQAAEPDVHLSLTRAGVTGVQKAVRIGRGRGEKLTSVHRYLHKDGPGGSALSAIQAVQC